MILTDTKIKEFIGITGKEINYSFSVIAEKTDTEINRHDVHIETDGEEFILYSYKLDDDPSDEEIFNSEEEAIKRAQQLINELREDYINFI